ncbi:MAG TPA: entericidin A/B family lipoprotein [Phycisphaerales bacterium]|nr:entericidin A/B family lipoprotein [Phycisphaerales bacterium]
MNVLHRTTSVITELRIRSVLVPFMLIATIALVAACSTTEGFGKDIKSVGGGIEDSAARNK